MTRTLKRLDQKIAECDIFSRMTPEKRMDLSDAIFMSAIRSGTSIDSVLEVIRTNAALKERFFTKSSGNIFDYIDPQFRGFAEFLFLKKAGGGTPNASIGKGELLLLLLSDKTKKPTSGDIEFEGRQIEVKTNYGKLGIGSGIKANASAVAFCKKNKIPLRIGDRGNTATGHPVFDPTKKEDRDRAEKNLAGVLNAWWEGLGGEALDNPTWPKIRKAFLQSIATSQIKDKNTELLVFSLNGDFMFFKTPAEFVRYYNNDSSKFEYRAYQSNQFSLYLSLFE